MCMNHDDSWPLLPGACFIAAKLQIFWKRGRHGVLILPKAMTGENRQLVTDEPVEFRKQPVEVQDYRKITDHFRGIYRIYPNSMKKNRRMSTCKLVGLANTRISTG